MRDFLNGVEKIKTIMTKYTYVCRNCQLSYSTHAQAAKCCVKNKIQYKKADSKFDEEYNKITGGTNGI